ncbi:uroporphyrinogen decarboxylase [Candidatus Poribacteria bacterium]|nr:uroporphyrinogen decarboxylase [Candidatus Poribacteria bacterium]
MTTTTLSKTERYRLTVAGEETDRPPVWIMRQAGRYMPEYMKLRDCYSFREMCLNPEASVAATLLPLELLDIDILIIFNDILIPLEAMGVPVDFPGGGPVIGKPVAGAEDLEWFQAAAFSDPPVSQALRLLKTRTSSLTPVLGFAGAPFTLAAYAVEGKMSKNQHQIKELMFRDPKTLHEILNRITETAANYLISQIDEGQADGVQLFESWGGILAPPGHYEEFAAQYQRRLIRRVRETCPGTPIHLYVKGCGPFLEAMAESGADVISIDWTVSLSEARRRVKQTLQGNLDPAAVHVAECVERETMRMLEGFDWRRGWIANLGHGIQPQATMEGARAFVGAVQRLGERKGVVG